jgi:hypothetical protein
LKEGQEIQKQDLVKVAQELKEGQREISANCQRSQEKITAEVGKVTTEVDKIRRKLKGGKENWNEK